MNLNHDGQLTLLKLLNTKNLGESQVIENDKKLFLLFRHFDPMLNNEQ